MKKLKEKGFSLIEAVLYLAIVSIVLTAVVNFHLTLGGTSSKLSSNIDTSRNRRTALSKIDYLVKNSDGLLKDLNGDCSDFSSSPNSLALYFDDDTHLPGTCVSSGGGVKITVSSNKVKMTCYPDITYNGEYDSCNTTAGNSYNLTSSEVNISNTGLVFTTSTPSSGGFISLTTNFTSTVISGDQTQLRATSTATSTVALRNEHPIGLVAWYRFEDGVTDTAVDSSGDNDLTCSGTPDIETGLMNDGTQSFGFRKSDSDYCEDGNTDALNFDTGFTLAAWVHVTSTVDGKTHAIINKNDGNKGYLLGVEYHNANEIKVVCVFCDGSSCNEFASDEIDILTTYWLACIFDPINDSVIMMIKERGGLGFSVPNDNVLDALVNSDTNLQIASSTYGNEDYFDGRIDDIRIYNIPLSQDYIYALQTAGE